jgi:hypothetical protein
MKKGAAYTAPHPTEHPVKWVRKATAILVDAQDDTINQSTARRCLQPGASSPPDQN